jgi:hypothetical protein
LPKLIDNIDRQTDTNGARYSFNSSDSGRMSDTYGETSNSSVASSSGHSNRICSNTSNCSGRWKTKRLHVRLIELSIN